jgi:hypothetical protein
MVFFLLAGFLAANSSRPPGAWFRGRLAAIYPAFWVVTCVGFCFAAVTGFKPFDGWQVLSQMAGIGYFTHGERMINVPTWFISPLLALYCVVLVLRQRASLQGWWLALAASLCLAMAKHDHLGTVGCHAATFFAAALISLQPQRVQSYWCIAAAVFMAALIPQQNEFLYGVVSLTLLAAAFTMQTRWRLAERFTGLAYEWFLVHGICLLLFARLTTSLAVLAPVAMVVSVLAAVLLKRFVCTLNQLAERLLRAAREGASVSDANWNATARVATADSATSSAVCVSNIRCISEQRCWTIAPRWTPRPTAVLMTVSWSNGTFETSQTHWSLQRKWLFRTIFSGAGQNVATFAIDPTSPFSWALE